MNINLKRMKLTPELLRDNEEFGVVFLALFLTPGSTIA
jgi:hypothetical protein